MNQRTVLVANPKLKTTPSPDSQLAQGKEPPNALRQWKGESKREVSVAEPDDDDEDYTLLFELVSRVRASARVSGKKARSIREELARASDQMDFHQRADFLFCDYSGRGKHRDAAEVGCQQLEGYPEQIRTLLFLADSLAEMKQLELALECADLILYWVPDCPEATELCLRLLKRMERPWREHRWPEIPTVVELNQELLDRCYAFLEKKTPDECQAAEYWDFRHALFEEMSLDFGEKEFIAFLEGDERFENIGDKVFSVFMLREDESDLT